MDISAFQKFCRDNGVKYQKDIRLLIEAYRRVLITKMQGTWGQIWLGLGTPSQYKSDYFKCFDGRPIARQKTWWVLNEKGVDLFEKIVVEFPFPVDPIERDQLNDKLFNL